VRRAAVFIILCAASAPALAGFSSRSRGTAAVPFLTFGGGARAAAMAGAQAASAEGAASAVWNPAAPAAVASPEIELMHADWFEGADYEFAAAAVPVGTGNAITATYQQFGVGDLERRDDSGFEDGSFEPKDTAAGLGFAWTTGGYHFGALAKMVSSKIVSSADTFAADLGAISPEIKGRRWGVAVSNLGGRLKYDAAEEDLPVVVSAGGQQRFGRNVVTGDLKFPRDNRPYLALAAEAGLALGGALEGRGRLGYSSRPGSEAGSLAGFSIGAGVRGRLFSFDYAFAPFGDLGSVHLFSLAVRAGGSGR
jgi:hypothetical protein